ncbi:MAG: FecR family protein [Planctomycetaceae bacterium]
MSDADGTYELLLRYLDDALCPEERARVETMLREQAAVRESLREVAHQAVTIADVDRVSLDAQRNPYAVHSRSGRPRHTAKWPLAVAAVAILAVVATQLLVQRDREPEIFTVNGFAGRVKWIGNGGQVSDQLAAGQQLPGGTLELLSADAWIEIQFLDGSQVSLSGHSAVTVSDRRQKMLHLRQGTLSAQIEPQPANRPLLVHTDAADLQVLGTQFNVDAQTATTKLTVNEGRVRLTRVADGQEIDVPARHQVIASIADDQGLALSRRCEHVTTWQSDLKSDATHGKWTSNLKGLGGRLKKAVALGEMTKQDALAAYKAAATLDDAQGSVWAMPSAVGPLVVLSVSRSSPAPVILTARARFRIQGRRHSADPIEIGITTNKPHGGFAAKYSVSIALDALPDDDNTFEIELPLDTFRKDTSVVDSPVGKELGDWWCVSQSRFAKLEITSVELVE